MIDIRILDFINLIAIFAFLIYFPYENNDTKKLKKEGHWQYVKKDSWFQKTYVWKVFFRRAFYRPIVSTFPYILFILPAFFIIYYYLLVFDKGYPLNMEELTQVTGVINKTNKGRGRATEHIILKDINGEVDNYKICCFYNKEEAYIALDEIKRNKQEVTIWYEKRRNFLLTNKYLKELKVENDFIRINNRKLFKYDYQYSVKEYVNSRDKIIWWLKYSILGWIWLWWLNKKELPIHRLNKMKYNEKNKLKDYSDTDDKEDINITYL